MRRRTSLAIWGTGLVPLTAVGLMALAGGGAAALASAALVGITVAGLLAFIMAKRLSTAVEASIAGALEIAGGNFGVTIKVEGRNELSDLAHTFNYMSQQISQFDKHNKELIASLERGYIQTIVALANSIDSKDRYTRGHSQRVGDLAMEMGKEMGLEGKVLQDLRFGGILHDIGKIGAPEHILQKRDKLTDEEMAVMREHPTNGASIVEPVGFLADVLPAVRNHHERWDGNGYPDRLQGEAIPLIARIVTAADVWDACTSTRPYSKAMAVPDALEVIKKLGGNQLDPTVAKVLVAIIEKRRAASDKTAGVAA